MQKKASPATGSFRVPNSIIQGLTTGTAAELNRLPPFTMTVLLGLLSLVDPRRPGREVRARPSDVLEVVEVGKSVAHAVEREWITSSGERRRRRYTARRYSPRQMVEVHQALQALHSQTVVVRRRDPKTGARLEDRTVHLLDMFGYAYERDGRPLDVDDLPPGVDRVNVGTPQRPLWRLRRRNGQGEQTERPSGILFRLNTELAAELQSARGSIGFTLLARKVFGVLRTLCHAPAAMRLLILVLRQTEEVFHRPLETLLDDLGWDPGHRARTEVQLREALDRLRTLGVVLGFQLDLERGRVTVTKNADWHECDAALPVSAS
jgi:hypothetical protein